MVDHFEEVGAQVLGPFAGCREAIDCIEREDRLDAAVLDISLGEETSYRVAEHLSRRQVPFVFVTGYDQSSLDDRYIKSAPILQKPFSFTQVVQLLFASTSERSFPHSR